MAVTAQEGMFLKQLFNDLNGECKIDLHGDNQGALALTKNPVRHQRTKHIDVRFHFVRSLVLDGKLNVHYIPTEHNIADILTKGLGRVKFASHRLLLFG